MTNAQRTATYTAEQYAEAIAAHMEAYEKNIAFYNEQIKTGFAAACYPTQGIKALREEEIRLQSIKSILTYLSELED